MADAGSCLADLQAAVHAKLTAYTGFASLTPALSTSAIYDEVPANTAPEYLQHGDAHEDDTGSTFEKPCRLVDFAVEVWSNYRGSKRVKEIGHQVALSLIGLALSNATWKLDWLSYKRTIVTRQQDGIARWAAVWFRAMVQTP